MSKFAQTLYVRKEKDGDTEYYTANDIYADAEHGERVAVYKLVEVKEMKIKRELI